MRFYKRPMVVAALVTMTALLTIEMYITLPNLTAVGAVEKRAAIQQVLAAVAGSYNAMDTAMNAPAERPNPLAVLSNQQLLLPAQAHVSISAEGATLYEYDLYRLSVFRTWATLHAHDYSAIAVWSTFQPASVTVNASHASVKGNETLHIDATVQNNGLPHRFSGEKNAVQSLLRRTGLFLDFGKTNHAEALISHTINLSRRRKDWAIETDSYWDPLVQYMAADHRSLLKPLYVNDSQHTFVSLRANDTYSYTYNRQQAINYAESWWNSCNPTYVCYTNQDVDCANFVSQAIYDGSGGNLPGDNYWFAGSTDFINADGLYHYLVSSPSGSMYNYAAAFYSSSDYGTAAFDDNWYDYPGDLIFYDWGNIFGSGPAEGSIDHVAISVSQDANGYTYEDSHTTNLHDYYWDLGGGTQTGYYFVILKDNSLSTWA